MKNRENAVEAQGAENATRQPSKIGNIKSLGNATRKLYDAGVLTGEEFSIIAEIHKRILEKEMGGLSL